MDEELETMLKKMKDVLGQEKMPDNIKSFISLLSNNDKKGSSETESTSNNDGVNDNNSDVLGKIRAMMDHLPKATDTRADLLRSMQPFLSGHRKNKVDEMLKLLRMYSMARILLEGKDLMK